MNAIVIIENGKITDIRATDEATSKMIYERKLGAISAATKQAFEDHKKRQETERLKSQIDLEDSIKELENGNTL